MSNHFKQTTHNTLLYICTSNSSVVYVSPLADCQTFTVAGFKNILQENEPLPILKDLYENICGKKQMLVNVKDDDYGYIKKFDKLLDNAPGSTILRFPYVSTNGSNMVMYLVNIPKLLKL